MGELVNGDDGLPAEEVGSWAEDKHNLLRSYLKYQAHPRARFIGAGKPGATYIDLFCGAGRAVERQSRRFHDGSPVLAWRASVEQGKPFSAIYISDADSTRLDACEERLRRLGAPVHVVRGNADEATRLLARILNPEALHFAFVDPYSLGALSLPVIQGLAAFKRMDILVHFSVMDLFRNLEHNLAYDSKEFDNFAPGWRDHVQLQLSDREQRQQLFEYWKSLVDGLGLEASTKLRPIKNSVHRDLYWLLLLYRHNLAEKFWDIVLRYQPNQTGDLFD
jgi:three-Cys-motif partner protein